MTRGICPVVPNAMRTSSPPGTDISGVGTCYCDEEFVTRSSGPAPVGILKTGQSVP